MKKILITYASYGSGHKTTAEYIYDYFKENGKYEIKLIDMMDYGNIIAKINHKTFNSAAGYNNMLFKMNNIFFTFTYELFDSKVTMSIYKEIVKVLFKSDLKKEIVEFNPDFLISTHFFGGTLMGMINKKYKLNTKIITILTDYASHAIWLKNHKREDAFIVSNEIVKNELIKYGVSEDKIFPYGIPLSTKFKNLDVDITKVKEKYKVNNDKLTFLFFGGGSSGASYTFNYLKKLANENLDINIIFVSGKNTKLENKCKKYIEENNLKNINILGFTKDISNLLNISDIVITKPGGLSVTESLEMKTPMILIPGAGGQENHNAKFIVKNNFGIRTRYSKQLANTAKKLVKNQDLIIKMKNSLNKYDENKSVEKLFKLVKEMEKTL